MSNQQLNGWNPQKTVYTYAKDRKYETGLRKAALYADLGLAEATGGQFHGELIKINPDYAATQEEKQTTGMHRHQYDFQFNYVLAGDIDLVIEEEEETTFRAGDTYFIPSRALHDETRVSKDFQVMQIYGPAKAETVTEGQAVGGGEVSDDWSDKLSKMKEQSLLTGWNKQKPAFTFANSREWGPGLRPWSLYVNPILASQKLPAVSFMGRSSKSIMTCILLRVRPECIVTLMISNLTTCCLVKSILCLME